MQPQGPLAHDLIRPPRLDLKTLPSFACAWTTWGLQQCTCGYPLLWFNIYCILTKEVFQTFS